MRLENGAAHLGIIDRAASIKPVATSTDKLDVDGWLLATPARTVSLRDGAAYAPRPTDLLTHCTGAEFDVGASCPRWEEHLKLWLPDADIRRELQRSLGQALVGATLEESLVVWNGPGGNGKTTSQRVITRVLGDYAATAPPDLLIDSRQNEHSTRLASLRGKRLVFSNEVANGSQLAESLVKQLTGGDRITARLLYADYSEFENQASLVLVCNTLPRVKGGDQGIWRRLRVIPWRVELAREKRRAQDDVIFELVTEGPGILNWMLSGLVDFRELPDWHAAAVTAATMSYRAEEDVIGNFLADRCVVGMDRREMIGALYAIYQSWCEESGEVPVTKQALARRLHERGYASARGTRGSHVFLGLALKSDSSDSK